MAFFNILDHLVRCNIIITIVSDLYNISSQFPKSSQLCPWHGRTPDSQGRFFITKVTVEPTIVGREAWSGRECSLSGEDHSKMPPDHFPPGQSWPYLIYEGVPGQV